MKVSAPWTVQPVTGTRLGALIPIHGWIPGGDCTVARSAAKVIKAATGEEI